MAITAEPYARQLAALLPPGMALAVEPGSELETLLLRLAAWLADVDARSELTMTEAKPWLTVQLLPEWETSLGLPVGVDDVTNRALSIAERQQRVVQKLLDQGGQRLTRYYLLAAALGYSTGTLERTATRRVARAGSARAGQPVASTTVTLPPAGQVEFRRLPPLISGFEAGAECAPPAVRFGFEVRYTPLPDGESGPIDPLELIKKIQRIAHAQSVPIFRSMYAPH